MASTTFHIEASKNPLDLVKAIRSAGSKVAVAIKPGTALSRVEDLYSEIDMLLIMTVEPGFGGQPLIEGTLEKVSTARDALKARNLEIAIQVDGGVTPENINVLSRLGAYTFVAGSSVFNTPDRQGNIARLRDLARF